MTNRPLSIVIKGDSKYEALSVTLTNILDQVIKGSELNWTLLWIKAIGHLDNNMPIVDFETEVNESANGLIVQWDLLKLLSSKLQQTIELLLIGDHNRDVMKRYSDDEDMYSSCEYTIELIDSSYWVIHSKNDTALQSMKRNLPGVEYNNE